MTARVHRIVTWTYMGFIGLCTALLLLHMMGCANLNPPEILAPPGYHLEPHGRPRLADKVIVGTIVKIEAAWLYDDPCGILSLSRCDGTRAYELTISTAHGQEVVLAFVPHDGFMPLPLGLYATYQLTKTWVIEYQKCRAGAPYTNGSACQTLGSLSYVLVSEDDVLPPPLGHPPLP